MNVHELTLQNYAAGGGCPSACQPMLYLGTAGSYGNEQINVVLGEGWQGLTVKAVFQPSGVPVVVPDGGGVISVPWEATQSVVAYPNGRISFQGYVSGRLVNTSDVPYTVGGSSAGSDNTPAPTPDEFQQFVDAVKSDADRAAQAAADAEAAVQKVTDAGTQAVTDIGNAKDNALEAIGQTEQAAINQVKQAGETQAAAVQSAGTTQVDLINNAGAAQVQAVKDAGAAQVQAVKDEGEAQTSALDDAAAAHKTELESIASHPPQPNTATGKWQVWDAETGAYQDTDALYQGGYYTPAVSDDGVLTWQGSQAGMPSLPSANVKGPKGDKGDPGLGVPTPTTSDAGKVPTVKADGSAYELAGPYAPLSAAIRPTASGNPVSITDSVEWPLLGLKVYGKSTQDGTPSPESPVPIVSAGDGGSVDIIIYAGNLFDTNSLMNNKGYDPNGRLITSNGRVSTPKIERLNTPFYVYVSNRLYSIILIQYNNSDELISRTFPVVNSKIELDSSCTKFAITVYDNVDYDEIKSGFAISYVQLDKYYPYQSSQSLTISTPNGLPGIPVDSGGNYTDAEGQRRWADVIDYSNEKKHQYINEVVVDGTNIKFMAASGGKYWNLPRYSAPSTMLHAPNSKYINKYFPSNVFLVNEDCDFIYTMPSLMAPYFETIEELNAFCVQKNTEGNPLTIMYVMDTPIETPLSEEEIAAYRALHTYNGITVVSTAEDVAGLEVKYVADAQKYIDNRLTAVESHIQEIAATQLNAQTGG